MLLIPRLSSEPLFLLTILFVITCVKSEPKVNKIHKTDCFIFISSRSDHDTDKTQNTDIFIQQLGDSSALQVTYGGKNEIHPDLSPDGKKIAFVEDNKIYIINRDGTKKETLMDSSNEDDYPTWSPDGRFIAFTSNRNDTIEIYKINLSSKKINRITHNNLSETNLQWSPDGKKIAFSALSIPDFIVLYTVNIDGTDEKILAKRDGYFYSEPSWSPGSEKIAFTSWCAASVINKGASFQILYLSGCGQPVLMLHKSNSFVMLKGCINVADTTGMIIQTITDTSSNCSNPAWSPDGKYLLYNSGVNKSIDIFSYSFETEATENITNNSGEDYFPRW